MQTKPYSGLRVVDFTTTLAGPHCTRMLADLGAEVIKLEAPDGDMLRYRLPLRDGASTIFGHLNAGKKSVVVDLKTEEGRETARQLALSADILVENYRPGVMEKFDLDYSTLLQANPRLIYCSISGFGQSGPLASFAAYAPVIHAASGYDLTHLSYQSGREKPDYCGIYIADVIAGTYAFGAIGVALHMRGTTGKGQMIDVSMLESMLSLLPNEMQQAQFSVERPSRPLFGPVETKDGYVMLAVGSEKSFHAIAHGMGRPEILTDPRFRKYLERRTNWSQFMEIVEDWSRDYTSAECLARFTEMGVPASAYKTMKEVLDDPQLAHRGALVEVEDGGGTFLALNPPFQMSAADVTVNRRVAALGEHTQEFARQLDDQARDAALAATVAEPQ